MAYSLETARTELKRSLPWLTRTVDMEPLEGLVDGSNVLFHLPLVPADSSAGASFYNAAGTAVAGGTVLNYEHGSVRFSTAPSATVYGSYTAQSIADAKLLDLCKAGFDEMESRYRRDYSAVVGTGGSTFVSSVSGSVTDPAIGSGTFSTSRVQVDFLLSCIEYRLYKALSTEAALNAIMYREERAGGLMVDRSRQAAAFKALLDECEKRVQAKGDSAKEEAEGTSAFGDFLAGAQSDTYAESWDWWTTSEQASGGGIA